MISQRKQLQLENYSKMKREFKYDFDSESDSEDRGSTSKKSHVTLKDLCREDKKKIGNLIKRLAEEKADKEKLVIKQKNNKTIQRIEETKREYEEKLKQFYTKQTKSRNESEDFNKSKTFETIKSKSENEKSQLAEQKIQQLKQEINDLDQEIQSLIQIDNQQEKKNQSVQKIDSQRNENSIHQSPNFKILLSNNSQHQQKQQFEQLFKQQLHLDPTSSFFQSQIVTQREQSLLLNKPELETNKRDQVIQTSLTIDKIQQISKQLTPAKSLEQQSIISNEISFQSQMELSRKNEKENSSSKKTNSKKKMILMQKIQEFEKIVNRLNFSKLSSVEESPVDNHNQTMIQDVYRKILCLEEELLRINNEKKNQESSISKRQLSETQNQSQTDNIDLVIQLLNSTNSGYKSRNDSQTNKKSKEQSEIYSNSFFSLVENIDIIETRKNKASSVTTRFGSEQNQIIQNNNMKDQDIEYYCKSVLSKYNDLMRELQQDMQRSVS